ncbi:MAG: type III pantothenate kinase [Bacteroidales bacterium]|nr:type III pantothenate kinase [Bacteroidales bacterium]
MMLAIDVGNTLSKLAVFDRNEIIFIQKEERLSATSIRQLFNQYQDIRSVIVASVKDPEEPYQPLFPEGIPLIILNHNTPLPIKIDYDTPETLGMDRLSAVVAAHHLFPGKNALVIESGTCITYDLIDAKGFYRGGSISPGIDLRFKALHNFTGKLPLVKPVKDAVLTAKSTETSIQSGVMNGIIAEINGIISVYDGIYENLTVILSGGNLDYFDKNLKNNIFAVPNIVLKGLNIIHNFNDKN